MSPEVMRVGCSLVALSSVSATFWNYKATAMQADSDELSNLTRQFMDGFTSSAKPRAWKSVGLPCPHSPRRHASRMSEWHRSRKPTGQSLGFATAQHRSLSAASATTVPFTIITRAGRLIISRKVRASLIFCEMVRGCIRHLP